MRPLALPFGQGFTLFQSVANCVATHYNYFVRCIVPTEYAAGQQISKLADESLVPTDTCSEGELLQFAERFLEWALINKEVHESEDPASLDLNSAITQARLFGLTRFEKNAVLKVKSV